MNHVAVRFDTPDHVPKTNDVCTLRILEAIRLLDLTEKIRTLSGLYI